MQRFMEKYSQTAIFMFYWSISVFILIVFLHGKMLARQWSFPSQHAFMLMPWVPRHKNTSLFLQIRGHFDCTNWKHRNRLPVYKFSIKKIRKYLVESEIGYVLAQRDTLCNKHLKTIHSFLLIHNLMTHISFAGLSRTDCPFHIFYFTLYCKHIHVSHSITLGQYCHPQCYHVIGTNPLTSVYLRHLNNSRSTLQTFLFFFTIFTQTSVGTRNRRVQIKT